MILSNTDKTTINFAQAHAGGKTRGIPQTHLNSHSHSHSYLSLFSKGLSVTTTSIDIVREQDKELNPGPNKERFVAQFVITPY